jgi:hypothetical protein
MEIKQQILKVIEQLPDATSVEDAIDRLYLSRSRKAFARRTVVS